MKRVPKWVFWVVAIVFLGGVTIGEYAFRRVCKSADAILVLEWVRNDLGVKKMVGTVTDLEIKHSLLRYRSSYMGTEGCFHVIVHGTNGIGDLLITWDHGKNRSEEHTSELQSPMYLV